MRDNFTIGVTAAAIVALSAIAAVVAIFADSTAGTVVIGTLSTNIIGLMNLLRLEENKRGMEKLTNGFIKESVIEANEEVRRNG